MLGDIFCHVLITNKRKWWMNANGEPPKSLNRLYSFLLDVVNSSKISLLKDIWSIFIEIIGAYRNQGDFTNNVS